MGRNDAKMGACDCYCFRNDHPLALHLLLLEVTSIVILSMGIKTRQDDGEGAEMDEGGGGGFTHSLPPSSSCLAFPVHTHTSTRAQTKTFPAQTPRQDDNNEDFVSVEFKKDK